MTLERNHVRPKTAISKAKVSAALGAGWARVVGTRKGAMADAMEIDVKTINRALTHETTPELHTSWNSLVFDFSALDEVAALYGARILPLHCEAANDMTTLADVTGLASALARALGDGKRNHLETLELAALIRPVICELSAIVAEADEIKGVAA